MNGKSDISTMNPCSREMDIHTYGFRWLNFSTHGSRWLRVCFLGACLDLYWGGKKCFYSRTANAGTFFFWFGDFTWPLPDLQKRRAA